MKRILATLIALAFATPVFACNYGFASVGACYAPPVVAQIAYAAPVVSYVQQIAVPVQLPVYTPPIVAAAVDYCPQAIQLPAAEVSYLQSYNAFQAVNYLQTNYGCSNAVAIRTLQNYGHAATLDYYGGASAGRVRAFGGVHGVSAAAGFGGARAFAGGRAAAGGGGQASVAIQGRRGEAIAATGNRVDVRSGIFGTRVRAR